MRWKLFLSGFLVLMGGAFTLAYSQVSAIFLDPARSELQGSSAVGDTTFVLLSAILLASGLTMATAAASPSRPPARAVALTGLWLSTFLLILIHLSLFVNAISVSTETDLGTTFSASYLFHTGETYTLLAVFLLYLVTLGLLLAFVVSLGVLVSPDRFLAAVWSRRDWTKNEAVVVSSGLLLVLSLSIFFAYLLKIAVRLEQEDPPLRGIIGSNLLLFYYLQIVAMGLLILVAAARVFLVNWAIKLPLDPQRIEDTFDNLSRLERVLVGAALVFNVFIILAPPATGPEGLSGDNVFLLNSRGLAWLLPLLAIPYVPYAMGQRRLRNLIAMGRSWQSSPFSPRSLKMVLSHLGGLVLLTAMGLGASWSPLGMMIGYSAWTSLVFLLAAVELRLEGGLLEPELRDEAAPPVALAFIVTALATGLMMWGAGNTFVGTYQESTQAFEVYNASPFGADLFFRVFGAGSLAFTVLLGLALARNALGVRRTLVGHHLAAFFSFVILLVMVFSVGIWSRGIGAEAFVGYAFHQFGTLEKFLVAGLLAVTGLTLLWSLSRLVAPVLRGRPGPAIVAARRVR